MSRLEKIAKAIGERGFDAVLITGMENCCYATSFEGLEGIVFITKDGTGYCYTDSRYIEAATQQIAPLGYTVVQGAQSYPKQANELCVKHGVARLAFEDFNMTVAQYERYKAEVTCEMQPVGNCFELLREVKEEAEVAFIEKAQRCAESALSDILGVIKPGMTEKELAAQLDYFVAKYGSSAPSFGTIFVSGAKGSLPHGTPGDKVIELGDFITMDFGAVCGGYHSDMTRTVAVGKASDEQKKVYNIVLQAQLAGIDALEVGATGHDVDAAARNVIEKAGYGEYFGHSLGHSLGLNIHENPRAAKNIQTTFKQGNIITIEPGIYLPGKFGVRIEDMVYLAKDGKRNLTRAPKELIII